MANKKRTSLLKLTQSNRSIIDVDTQEKDTVTIGMQEADKFNQVEHNVVIIFRENIQWLVDLLHNELLNNRPGFPTDIKSFIELFSVGIKELKPQASEQTIRDYIKNTALISINIIQMIIPMNIGNKPNSKWDEYEQFKKEIEKLK